MSGAKGGFRDGILDLSAMVPKLPKVKFPSGNDVQLRHLTAEGYEQYRTLRRLTARSMEGDNDEATVDEIIDTVDSLLRQVLPEATPDDLASLGFRMEARMAPIFAVAGEVDSTVAALIQASQPDEDDEGKATRG